MFWPVPNPKPMTFSADTHARIRKISSISHVAADLSAKTVAQVSKYAQNAPRQRK
ncbi:hypothetical protein V1524DRAFT_442199 [Lipomyces starkeyi]